MIDNKLIRENIDLVKKNLLRRRVNFPLDEVISIDENNREITKKIEALNNIRNKTSEEFSRLKRDGRDTAILLKEMEKVKAEIKKLEEEKALITPKLINQLLFIPNILDESVPDGESEKDNKVVREELERKDFGFKVLPHWEIGENLGILDFKRAAKLSGARFALLSDKGAVLERALINFMVDLHRTKHGYKEICPPYLVLESTMRATGQLPKFSDELFKCKDDELYLIPTAEVPLTNLHREEIIQEEELPIKYVSYTACFRREAGSYGKDTKGLIRNHQFNKVELLKFVHPEKAKESLNSLLGDAEEVLKLLEIPYRIIELCSADVGFAAAKTYDIEVWMPGENRWREISSCSLFTDFQSRRLGCKYRDKNKKLRFVYTLNGSGVAVGRTMAAILENFQTKNKKIMVPKVLEKYLDFDSIS
ncbi:MAG: serine--tRNA ligase [bacterium]